ncbi:SecY-interacting protein [Shewanella inventionis]|uniref:Protein Syd n=1 Tax=Shewanella inventionis TaxID=1738770 RepID=A0ABQ1JBH3_9GAMM|nr:SecY-interacting protein [Shewanella inventionis]MCL1158615.1 SecY-interacting protein [Shewanella inventionis]GGB62338.1 protein Syd [Shewanella inventionis]
MSCSSALDCFIKKYLKSYQDTLSEFPRYYLLGEDSICIQGTLNSGVDDTVFWQPMKREVLADFSNVEHALNIQLHPDIHAFYGQYFSAPLQFTASFGDGELLQVWNQDDFENLQQNVIGHLIMKQKLKQPATWFIGVLGEGDEMLTVNNDDGSVWIEIPDEKQGTKLAESLSEFLQIISPMIKPPQKPVEEHTPIVEHPGIWQRINTMWDYLLRKK